MPPLHPGEADPQEVFPGQGRQAGELTHGAPGVSLSTCQALRSPSNLLPLPRVGEALHPLLLHGICVLL